MIINNLTEEKPSITRIAAEDLGLKGKDEKGGLFSKPFFSKPNLLLLAVAAVVVVVLLTIKPDRRSSSLAKARAAKKKKAKAKT